MAKVLLINGSPRENGNTFIALSEVAKTLNEEGVDTEIISIYYGNEVSEEDAGKLAERCRSAFSGKDVELQYGGQPVYYYILSAE